MNTTLQIPDAFAVNHAHLQDAKRAALGEILGNEFTNVLGPERVQVEHAVNGQRLRRIVIHKLQRGRRC